MKKFIKAIIGIICFFIFSIILVLGIFIFFTYDNEKITYDASQTHDTLEQIFCDDTQSSLKNIYDTNYEDNKLEINFSVDEINSYIVDLIRDKVEPEYLISKDYIISKSSLTLNSILFVEGKDCIKAKARMTAANFYKTTASLGANVTIDENNLLTCTFENFSIGRNITVKRDLVLKIFKNLNLQLGESSGFNFDQLTFTLDVNKIFKESLADQFLYEILDACDHEIVMGKSGISLIFDTTKLFDKGTTIPSYSENFDAKLIAAAASKMLILTGPEFNTIVQSKLDPKKLINTAITFGDAELFTISLDDMYFDLATSSIKSNLLIDDLKSNVQINANIAVTGGNAEISASSIFVGSLSQINASTIISKYTISAQDLGMPEGFSIESFVVKNEDETLVITFK